MQVHSKVGTGLRPKGCGTKGASPMENASITKRLSRFNWCDKRFYPYIEKVLMRLPKEICFGQILDDLEFDIVSFGDNWNGCFLLFRGKIDKLVILSETLLGKPEYEIIHAIAHEIAHKIIGRGETGLYEKEAEDLVVKWGFQQESQKVAYSRPELENEGYKIGYEWAKRQSNISRFEQFFDEWNMGELSKDRWDELYESADPASIVIEMNRSVNSSKDLDPADAVRTEMKNLRLSLLNDGSYENGIVNGVMGFLQNKKQHVWRALSTPELSGSEKNELFWKTLKEGLTVFQRLYDQETWEVFHIYAAKYPEVKAFQDALKDLDELLEH
jgi:hypothetical protein